LSEQIISNGENNPAFSVTANGGNNGNENNSMDQTAAQRPHVQLRKRASKS
jgi:hypothetical protein